MQALSPSLRRGSPSGPPLPTLGAAGLVLRFRVRRGGRFAGEWIEEMHPLDLTVFLGLVVVVVVVAALVRTIHVPYTIALVVVGLALALLPHTPHVEVTPALILTVFLPVLLFHGAYNLEFAAVRADLLPVAWLAVPGVAVTAAAVGVALHLIADLPWDAALALGAIVGATDPVAVLSIFRDVGAPRRLRIIVEAESLFNDGTALILFSTVVGAGTAHVVSPENIIERFAVALAGSVALGIAVGALGSAALARLDDALVATAATLIMAYGGYLLADHLSLSGPLETATAGLLFGVHGERVLSPTARVQARATWEFLDFLANSLLFLLMGLAVRPVSAVMAAHLGATVWLPLAVVIVAMTAARVVVAWAVAALPARVREPLPRGWPVAIAWAGLRGAVSLAAALSLPRGFPQRDLLLALTFGVVLVTLLAQGVTMRPLLLHLGLGADRAAHRDVEAALGRVRAVEAALREVDALRREAVIAPPVLDQLEAEYRRRRQDVYAALEALYQDRGQLRRQQEREARRRVLYAQRAAVRGAAARGLLSRSTLRDLLAEIDRGLSHLDPAATDASDEDQNTGTGLT